jgi:hypothetical protein
MSTNLAVNRRNFHSLHTSYLHDSESRGQWSKWRLATWLGFDSRRKEKFAFSSGCPDVHIKCTETDRSCKFVLRPGIYGDFSQCFPNASMNSNLAQYIHTNTAILFTCIIYGRCISRLLGKNWGIKYEANVSHTEGRLLDWEHVSVGAWGRYLPLTGRK